MRWCMALGSEGENGSCWPWAPAVRGVASLPRRVRGLAMVVVGREKVMAAAVPVMWSSLEYMEETSLNGMDVFRSAVWSEETGERTTGGDGGTYMPGW